MATLIPVKYDDRRYPNEIYAEIKEESAPLWIPHLKRFANNYSLHTDPSSKRRGLDSSILESFHTLRMAYANGIAQLWFNKQWAEEFAEFIKKVVDENYPPLLIEIHPPYKDYCPSMEQFLEYYRAFEGRISSYYSATRILIENRFGTNYKRSNFLVSSFQDIVDLVSHLERAELGLGIVIDLPQLLDQMGLPSLEIAQLKDMFSSLNSCTRVIKGIHLWGPRRFENGRMRGVHDGDLDTLFGGNKTIKLAFLEGLYEFLNDGVARYFVPEVRKDDQVASIVNDLILVGFRFQGPT